MAAVVAGQLRTATPFLGGARSATHETVRPVLVAVAIVLRQWVVGAAHGGRFYRSAATEVSSVRTRRLPGPGTQQPLRVRFHIIRNDRIENVGKSQACMVSKSCARALTGAALREARAGRVVAGPTLWIGEASDRYGRVWI